MIHTCSSVPWTRIKRIDDKLRRPGAAVASVARTIQSVYDYLGNVLIQESAIFCKGYSICIAVLTHSISRAYRDILQELRTRIKRQRLMRLLTLYARTVHPLEAGLPRRIIWGWYTASTGDEWDIRAYIWYSEEGTRPLHAVPNVTIHPGRRRHWPASVSSWKQHFSRLPTHNTCTAPATVYCYSVTIIVHSFIYSFIDGQWTNHRSAV